ncbi:MAG: aldo/keto reductase [Clostridiaceae bacterium]|nr:aldo/keto reductase [Clostridiaceae bacterium]
MDDDAVDISKIPYRTLNTGDKIPGIGMGTFGSDRYSAEELAESVRGGLRVGYRLIDCAEVYDNEKLIGDVIKEALDEGLSREELFIISKVWNNHHDPKDVYNSCVQSIKDLNCEYLDAYFVHWPFRNHHEAFADISDRDKNSRPYSHEEFMETWRAMEDLVEKGLVRNLGVSNVTIPKLKLILRDAKIKPALNEMELHPRFQQGELFQYSLDNDIQPVGYAPLGSPNRPERDKTEDDYSDWDHPVIERLANKYNVHPSSICLKWAVQRGQIPIPLSSKRKNYLANLKCVTEDLLTPREFDDIRSVERDNRLIKGHVFLWEGATDWRDLWDIDGTIPGWNGYGS